MLYIRDKNYKNNENRKYTRVHNSRNGRYLSPHPNRFKNYKHTYILPFENSI